MNAPTSFSQKDQPAQARERLVVIGNGMAGCRAVEEILARDPARFDVTIFGAEPRVNYNRIMLSPVLAGEKAFDDIVINDASWYADNGITLVSGDPVVSIDRETQTVVARSGRVEPYDRLLIATGSDPFIIPVPGHDLPGVVTFRDLDDVERMLAASERGGSAVVIGGGLLGLEAAHGLALRGMKVTVVHLMPTLMERQLDEAAGYLLRSELERRGQTIVTGGDTAEILGRDGHVSGVKLKDGREFAADIVVMAVGIRPATGLARAAGLDVERGILVDDHMMTSDPAVMAVGECVQHRGQCYGLVAPLWDMCRALADCVTGNPSGYEGSVTSTKLKVSGIDLFSAGDFSGGEGAEDIVMRDASRGIYKRVIVREDRVVGAVLYGDTGDGSWYFDLLKKGEDISEIREALIFGQAFAAGGALADPNAAVAALSDDAEICGCNGVSKGKVVETIKGGACSLDAVRSQCKASASCGSCTGLVESLLRLTLGGEVEAGPKTMCKCTSFTHSDVRRLIVEKNLRLIPQVMQELGWSTPDGCASCRPALNYYLLCAWPGEYEDDQQSRFVNERMHANIQKDGTYSVVPRMWGGLTNPRELRAIADVVEKYNAPMVKVTGGQRLDIFGIRKEDLPAVWADLNAAGMVSGHAYGKSLRTVKTCVGSEWCRFGTQDSTGLGVKLEQMTWGSWMPHKFKIAVSGCPRNCAEATIKDFGVVCVDSGYELHVGGNGGIKVRATDLLCRVATEAEAMEVCAAFIQLYREQAWYLERTAPWIERVGLEHVKAALFDDPEAVATLAARFRHSQQFMQDDPWAKRARGADAELHQHLAEVRPFQMENA
ncbi:assimilatory nitrite reductase (NAD(P)H) large subunit precursor [Novosphingobium aromaticivorans DSM 12444]|uniref:Assimilatory nitrite reductase (NAD(P)H) large subunit n=1 Tax=Novosphingobium aromaticivorans (strain ATCC 700278 / DSM 12444 / CCUG 56034 / CIP 105152 / NBRC 16084 / F199) TaxID=279238 RepID=Q2G420_NOVAD|nr:nitrite reductase large subunit NirB [Novosphingobium aromaticivorans]ABD27403.1 assimilatory nitrite reductase (NAD(P)H) large subunit precursor [Novosphingobium aromaticivorans DSM 12444]SCY68631.1 assimilatory nitrite reductase (NAD(P)H) large subunit precursor [Novosphingobium aromaticivorans]